MREARTGAGVDIWKEERRRSGEFERGTRGKDGREASTRLGE